ncbi:hypothetical protein Back11_63110 [Paenibacillus baekrokdamisoli]|uniref:Uncharacterized protein n=1 Tax=Paenibacillus baekrokdamisoli TaxID=1712516 RepID=A0A3G9J2I3_9BACL|nr:hypothetical protein [Paenibacillus baekrokdamisoli]MBB3069461.1 hypothetical protein [Paenibacillus baekrokdamisoli]BBH24966.1 hypothetical protein Back11_63110 [Paenibacillus baekrokdamisoli]
MIKQNWVRKLLMGIAISIFLLLVIGCEEDKKIRSSNVSPEASNTESVKVISKDKPVKVDKWTMPTPINLNSLAPEVKLDWNEGAPFINVNGESISPLILFFSADQELEAAREGLKAQLEYAKREKVKIVSINFSFPWRNSSEDVRSWYYAQIERWLDFVLENYPDVYIIPRVWLGMHVPDLTSNSSLEGDRVASVDGTLHNVLSLSSEEWKTGMIGALQDGITYLESNPKYGPHMIGYHISYGDGGEWFNYNYRTHGNDVSPANRKAFREWLLDYYGSKEAWAKAWDLEEIVDADPVIYSRPDSSGQSFLRPGIDQQFIDFDYFSSEIVADSIIAASRVVKNETDGKRLTMAFYGYSSDVVEGHSGHLALETVLASEYVDMLSSPISYLNRGVGGIGGFMTTVDSVTLHKKLWMIEDDSRTHLAASSDFDVSIGSLFPTAELTIEGHQRNLGAAIVHRTGLWWMDLQSKGWLNDSSLWKNIGEMRKFYTDYMKTAKPLKPDVAIIVDEQSMKYTGKGLKVNNPLLHEQRLSIYRAGLSFGIYLLDDVLNGSVPDAKMYVFLNTHILNDEQRQKLEELKKSDHTLVWVYGADFIGSKKIGEATGFEMEVVAGEKGRGSVVLDTNAAAPWASLAGMSLPLKIPDVPYYSIKADKDTTVIGHYESSPEKVGLAARDFGKWKSVFIAPGALDTSLIRAVAEYAGVHVYMESDDVLQTDGTFFSIHASSAGTKTLKLPANKKVMDALSGEIIGTDTNTIVLDMYVGETRWLVVE